MNIIENGLFDKMAPFEFKHLRDISSGSFGKVIEIMHKPSGNVFAMKVLDISEESPEFLIRSEINFLQDLRNLPQKPSIFPNFHGFFLSADETTGKRTFCLIFDLKKKNLNDLILATKGSISFKLFENVLCKFINGLAYLQTLQICHRDLKPQNILIDEKAGFSDDLDLTLIDFGISKRIIAGNEEKMTQENTVIGTEVYFSPEFRVAIEERIEVNAYKSDVFSLGLVMMKLAYGKLPIFPQNMSYEIERVLKEIEQKFMIEAGGIGEKEKRIEKIMNLWKEMLEIETKNRPDFIELFFRSLRFEENVEKIKKMILVKDNEDFMLLRSEFLQKPQILEEEKKEDIGEINENLNKYENLFNSINEFLERKSEKNPLNFVVSGFLSERIGFINKMLRFLGLKEDLLESPKNFIDVNSPFLLEILEGETYKTEFSFNSSNKTVISTKDFQDLKRNLKEILSNHAILLLSLKEKPFIHQKIFLKNVNFKDFRIFLISSDLNNKLFIENLKKGLEKNPTIFLRIKKLEIEKYQQNFLNFYKKIQRKNNCEFWTVFCQEDLFLQSFKMDEKDNEKSLILKKNAKLLKFQEIMKAEEAVLGPLTNRKKAFFLEFNETGTFDKIVKKSIDFLNKSRCEKALILMILSSKIALKEKPKKPLFPSEKIEEIVEKIVFFSSEFEAQIEVFFEKLHQGSLEGMKKNSIFLKELEKIVLKGTDLLKISQTFLSKRNFIKEVMDFLSGTLQDFMRKTIIEMLFPFLEIMLKEAMQTFGILKIEAVLGWKIEGNHEEIEKMPDLEKLIIGLLLCRNIEIYAKIREKMLVKEMKCLKLKEEAFNSISAYSGFWSYEGAKDDILKLILINLRENKAENIKRIVEIFNEISQEFFEKLRRFPIIEEEKEEKSMIIFKKTSEDLALQKETLRAVTSFNSEIIEFFSKENLNELQDECLKDVLQVKMMK